MTDIGPKVKVSGPAVDALERGEVPHDLRKAAEAATPDYKKLCKTLREFFKPMQGTNITLVAGPTVTDEAADAIDALTARIRELESSTAFAAGVEAAAKWHESQIPDLQKVYDEAFLNFERSGRNSDYDALCSRCVTQIAAHQRSATAIRALSDQGR